MKILADALKKEGLDKRSFSFGEVYWMDDADILPAVKKYLAWETHIRRPVVVMSNNETVNIPTIKTIQVASCTTGTRCGPLDVAVKAGEGQLESDCIVQVSLLETVPKIVLRERIGRLPRNRTEELMTRALQLFTGFDIFKK